MNIDEIAQRLEQSGYIILDQALPDDLLAALLRRCQDDGSDRFQVAHIGRGADKKRVDSIRGDVIHWLDGDDTTDSTYLSMMETLRRGLNERLYLGLFDYECHYAIYGAGTGYAKHLDVLNGKKNRILTTVLYLNQDWQPDDAGELVVFDATGEVVIEKVTPSFGKMIIFLSETFPHEVLTSHNNRRSIAGWFRVSGS